MISGREREVLKRKLELYEGRVEHMYLDTKGYVTIAVGHMIPNVGAAKKLNFVHHKTNVKANEADIISEYDRVKKQVKGLPASTYRKHTKLKISNLEIESLTNQHIVSFEKELKRIYGSEQFEGFPKSVRLALFDMIFNLGMPTLSREFVKFNGHIKDNNWAEAAQESRRLGIGDDRNTYVKELLKEAAAISAEAEY